IRVVDGEPCERICNGRDVGDGAVRAVRVVLPARLGNELATTRAGAGPHRLTPVPRRCRGDQAGATDRGDILRSRRVNHVVVAIVSTGEERADPGKVPVDGV